MGKRRKQEEGLARAEKTPAKSEAVKPAGITDALADLIGILVQRADVVAWLYDASADRLYYRFPEDAVAQRAEDFRMSSVAEEWAFLWHGDLSGSADVHTPFGHEEAVYRLAYRRTVGKDGIYAAGIAEDITEAHAAAARLKDGTGHPEQAGISGDEAIRLRVEAELALLHPGEKGVLFAVGIDSFEELEGKQEACVRVMENTLHAEFRGNDIFGRLSRKGRYIVFFCGSLSIDVVERRAQHFLDEFQRQALDTSINATCSLGIAVAGGAKPSAETLISAASAALNEALVRGTHHYRMFDSNRY